MAGAGGHARAKLECIGKGRIRCVFFPVTYRSGSRRGSRAAPEALLLPQAHHIVRAAERDGPEAIGFTIFEK